MRTKAIVAWVLVALALVLGYIGRAGADAFYLLSGFCFLAALGIAISFLPFWANLRDRVPKMPGLFPRAARGEWDPATGTRK